MADTTPTTQSFVPIKEIKDDVVLLKDGQLCAVLLTTSINLALKSADEQAAVLHQFQSFLNALDFSIQIYAQSRRYDVRPYLEYLSSLEPKQYNNLMKVQLYEYTQFIKTFTEDVAIMKRNFFIIVPYHPAAISTKSSFIPTVFRKSGGDTGEQTSFAKSEEQLNERVSAITAGLNGMGIKSARLGKEELVELFYHIYNPGELGSAPKGKEVV